MSQRMNKQWDVRESLRQQLQAPASLWMQSRDTKRLIAKGYTQVKQPTSAEYGDDQMTWRNTVAMLCLKLIQSESASYNIYHHLLKLGEVCNGNTTILHRGRKEEGRGHLSLKMRCFSLLTHYLNVQLSKSLFPHVSIDCQQLQSILFSC